MSFPSSSAGRGVPLCRLGGLPCTCSEYTMTSLPAALLAWHE